MCQYVDRDSHIERCFRRIGGRIVNLRIVALRDTAFGGQDQADGHNLAEVLGANFDRLIDRASRL